MATIVSIASEHGVSPSTVSRWKKLGINVDDPAAIRAHRESLQRDQSTENVDEMRKARLRKLNAEAKRSELHLALVQGQMLPRESVRLATAQVGHALNAMTRAMQSELPGVLAGLDAPAIDRALKPWIDDWVVRFKTARSDIWRQAEAAVIAELGGDARKAARRYFAKEESV